MQNDNLVPELQESLLPAEGTGQEEKNDKSDPFNGPSALTVGSGDGEVDARSLRPSVTDCLKLPDDEMVDLTLDVYNMFFLSEKFSHAFFYSIAVFFTKTSLYIILILDLTYNKTFPFDRREDASWLVMTTQIFLFPVAIMMQEELQTSFYIFANVEYSPAILARHPGAHKSKYYSAHIARLLDGAMFLFINTCVMLQSTDVLSTFLNFAALMFIQTIDNVALQVCLDGYWTKPLQDTAKDVVEMKCALKHHGPNHHSIMTAFFVVTYIGMVLLWANIHYWT